MTAPLFVLGVSRSGTTLLRTILDRSPGIAIPDETFFLPQLARRHRGPLDLEAFLEDVRRLPAVAAWGVSAEEIGRRLRPGMTLAQALDALYRTYAERTGKPRWGDKTPVYVRHLELIDRLFPEAQYVHLTRDGRDAAASYLALPEGVASRGAHARTLRGFACEWRTDVARARALGRRVGPSRYLEVRYEELVARPEETVQAVCAFARLPFTSAMLAYEGEAAAARKPHQRRLREPPRPGARNWRSELGPRDVRRFEEVAGDLLAELGYELADPRRTAPPVRARLALAGYRARLALWNAAASAVQRSPLWRHRHPRLF